MTQVEKVLAYMKEHGSITQRDAVSFGCYRLSARIHDIRHEMGIDIKTENETKYGSTYARYSIVGEDNG